MPKNTFVEKVRNAGYCDQPNRIRQLAKVIAEQRPKAKDPDILTLGDIEDYALGFLQDNTKLFVFGKVAPPLRPPPEKKVTNVDKNEKDAAANL